VTHARGLLQLCVLGEERGPEPPVMLASTFYEPGPPAAVAAVLRSLEEPVVAVAAPLTDALEPDAERRCDAELRRRGTRPTSPSGPERALAELLPDLVRFSGAGEATEGTAPEGAFRSAPLFETNVEAVFASLAGRRLPAKRHPLGVARRVNELIEDHLVDGGGDLWHRRIEELEAGAAALAAHRYAVGLAWWLGDPREGVVVLPGAKPLEHFSAEGVMPPVERAALPAVEAAGSDGTSP